MIIALHIHTHIIAALTHRPETKTFKQLNLTHFQLMSHMLELAKYRVLSL